MGRTLAVLTVLLALSVLGASEALAAPVPPVSPVPPAEAASPRDAPSGPDPVAGLLVGGSRCSAGFVVRTPAGTPGLLTAGHCTRSAGPARAAGSGAPLGTVRSSRYGPGGDWGVVDLTVTPSTLASPARHATGGSAPVRAADADALAVGAPVCRSGATTGRRCGVVVDVDVTANYGAGPIDGLVAISACSEPGDSGGPVTVGDRAAGLLSGGTGDCASGGVSLVQPIGPVLAREGAELLSP